MTAKKKAPALGGTAPKISKEHGSRKASPTTANAPRGRANIASGDRAVSDGVAAVLPADLLALRAWLVWRWGPPDPNGKRRKLPHYTNGRRRYGTQGSPSDLQQLATFEQAAHVVVAGKADGLGIAMLPAHGLTGLDFDNKADTKDPLLEAEVRALLPGCYVERSPSGKGFRAFVRGRLHLPKGARGIEAFSDSQFLTVTGSALDGVPSKLGTLTEERRQRIEAMAQKASAPERNTKAESNKPALGFDLTAARQLLHQLPDNWCDDRQEWLRVGMAMHHEFGGSNEALEVWDDWSQGAPLAYTNEGCAEAWRSFGKRKDAVTMGSLLHAASKPLPQAVKEAIAKAEFEAVPLLQQEPDSDDDLSSFALPEMPTAALYGVLHDIVEAATANSEATRPGVAAAALVHFAARFGKALGIDIGDERRTLPLFVLLVGPTGRGRKGTSSAFASQLFADLDALLALGWGDNLLAPRAAHVPPLRVVPGVSSGQGLIELVRDEGTYIHRGLERHVPGVEDKRILLELSEFAQIFSVSAQESSTLSMVLRDAFDARKLQSPSRNNPLESTGAHLSVLGHITMSEFRRRTIGDKRSTETQNGLLNRFCVLYSVREKVVSRPVPVPLDQRRKLAQALANNVHAVFERRYSDHRSLRAVVLPFADEARALWDFEYPRLTQQRYDTEIVSEMMARRELLTLTLAALLAAMNGETCVGVKALRAGLAWGEYMASTNARVFTTLAERKAATQLRGWVAKLRERLQRAGGSMELREVRAAFNKTAFAPTMQDAAIRAMVEASPPQLVVEGKTLRLLCHN